MDKIEPQEDHFNVTARIPHSTCPVTTDHLTKKKKTIYVSKAGYGMSLAGLIRNSTFLNPFVSASSVFSILLFKWLTKCLTSNRNLQLPNNSAKLIPNAP